MIGDVAWLQVRHTWPGLKTVVVVDSTREIGGRIERETRLMNGVCNPFALAVAGFSFVSGNGARCNAMGLPPDGVR